jgi:hypothetical protein
MAGPWPHKYAAYLRHVLRSQSAFDERKLPKIWFWHYEVDSSPHDPVFLETTEINRRFSAPFGIHAYVSWQTIQGPTRGGIDKENALTVGVSRAELLRVRLILEHKKELDFRLPKNSEKLFEINKAIEPYIFRPGDVFQWNNQLYTLNDVLEFNMYMGATDYPLTWKGVFNTQRKDSTDLTKPLILMPEEPSQVEWPERLAANG